MISFPSSFSPRSAFSSLASVNTDRASTPLVVSFPPSTLSTSLRITSAGIFSPPITLHSDSTQSFVSVPLVVSAPAPARPAGKTKSTPESDVTAAATEVSSVSCPVCARSLHSQAHLVSHLGVHTKERPFECPDCGQGFKSQSDLAQHRRTHSNSKPFECTACNKSFKRRWELTRHMRVHAEDPRPFECTDCGKFFQTKTTLSSHRRIHNDEKPFQCGCCNKTFKRKGEVTLHMRTHTGERPFKCPYCHKGFKQKGTLTQHLPTHSADRPYFCTMCSSHFKHKSSLTRHLRTHKGTAGGTQGLNPAASESSQTDSDDETSEVEFLADQVKDSSYRLFECTTCSTMFVDEEPYLEHVATHGSSAPVGDSVELNPEVASDDSVESISVPLALSCSTCGKGFKHRSSLHLHSSHCHGQRSALSSESHSGHRIRARPGKQFEDGLPLLALPIDDDDDNKSPTKSPRSKSKVRSRLLAGSPSEDDADDEGGSLLPVNRYQEAAVAALLDLEGVPGFNDDDEPEYEPELEAFPEPEEEVEQEQTMGMFVGSTLPEDLATEDTEQGEATSEEVDGLDEEVDHSEFALQPTSRKRSRVLGDFKVSKR